MGPLMGGPQCRLSILRNDNVPCRYFLKVPVDFKVVKCRLLNLRKRRVALSILRVKGLTYFYLQLVNSRFHRFSLLHQHGE